MNNTQSFSEPEFNTSNSPTTLVAQSDVKADVKTDVKVQVEKLDKRQRQVWAQIHIPYSLEQVWQVVTDYEAFAEFMPNLSQSRRLQHSANGVRLEQTRDTSAMGMNFSARSVFDIEEEFPHRIHYQLVEGDMKAFSGYWHLEPCSSSKSEVGINLIYNFFVVPKRIVPMTLVEYILNHGVTANLVAIRQRVADLYGD